jgi:hypothetical protein
VLGGHVPYAIGNQLPEAIIKNDGEPEGGTPFLIDPQQRTLVAG